MIKKNGATVVVIEKKQGFSENEKWYFTILKSIGDAVIATDIKSNITFLNPVAESITGWKQEEAMGKPLEKIFNIINEETRKRVENPIARVLREGIVVGLANHTILISKEGKDIPIADSGAPIKDDNGNIIGVVLIFRDITERKKAEEALQESEERLRIKLDFILSPDIEMGEVTLTDLIDLDHLQTIQDAFAKANNIASLITDTDGNPITKASNFSKVCEIIRGTKKGNEQCIRSDKIMGNKAKSLMKPIYEECQSCGFVDASAPIIVSGKYMANWLIGQSNVMGVDAKRIKEYAKEIGANVEEMLKAFSTMEQSSLEHFEKVLDLLWIMAKEISTIGYNNLKLAKQNENLKVIEKKLKESQEWLSTTLMSIGDAVIATNTGGNILLLNPIAESLTGWKQDEAIRKPIEKVFNIINEFSRKSIENPIARVLREGIVVGLANHTILISKDGKEIPIDDCGAPIKDEKGNIIGVVLIFRDITEQKKAKEKLKKYSENLEEIIDERTKELRETQEQLIIKEKLVVLGQVAGGLGHELRNPLGAIKNAAYFLNMALEQPEPEVKETLEILDKEIATSEKIINNLLDFTRSKPPILQDVNINEIIEEELERTIIPKNIEIVSQLSDTLPHILADPVQLVQIFRNIVLNAIQAMPEGGQLVVKSEVPITGWVMISFTDTGVGIPEENKEKVFEPLFTTKAKGIGLGLAVTKTSVEGQGGTIKVKSKVGNGSTFTIKLPFHLKEEKYHGN
ncbi:MAG: PocR ligand-binding domain-containing protein [Promethearchaeota archaeon]